MTKMPRYARWVNEQQCHWLGHESGSYRMCKIWEKIQFILSPMIKIACVTAKKLVCPSKASNPLSKHVDSSAWHHNRMANDKKHIDSIELLLGYNILQVACWENHVCGCDGFTHIAFGGLRRLMGFGNSILLHVKRRKCLSKRRKNAKMPTILSPFQCVLDVFICIQIDVSCILILTAFGT